MEQMEEFMEYLKEHPEEISRLKKREGMEDFKAKFHVDKASPLKCPACRDQWGGTLWMSTTHPFRFVCRKCKIVLHMSCISETNGDLIARLREANKEDKK